MLEVNQTKIALIPKIGNPTQMGHFRPISLCSVIYKIITKALANRPQKVIKVCIDIAQRALVPDKLIFNNILITYEMMLHTFKKKCFRQKGSMELKLDMSKAFDRVE